MFAASATAADLAAARALVSPKLVLWRPDDSYSGHEQADPRLDKPVTLWGAGIPLTEVFATVREQTGVAIGFDPPGDVNERVCVNVYLNPTRPPTLRALMSQLSWVTDCAFSTAGEGEGRTYSLLSTSIGGGAIEQLRSIDPRRLRTEAVLQEAAERHPLAVAMLPELRDALKLSREQAIRKYRSKNDWLLLTLLDPSLRPAAELICSLSEQEVASLRSAAGFTRSYEEWTPEQQALIREIMRCSFAAVSADMVAQAPDVDVHVDEPGWLEQYGLGVCVGGFQSGGFGVQIDPSRPPAQIRGRLAGLSTIISFGLLDNSYGPLDPVSAVRFRRMLGEPMSDDDEQRLFDEAILQSREYEQRKQLLARVSRERLLSKEAANSLAALPLPVALDERYALWQLQEAAASRSGRHLISDCFWQPERTLNPAYGLLGPQPGTDPSALSVLTAACVGTSERWALREIPDWDMMPSRIPPHETAVSWEWGDAGDFLRFRSAQRDVWRAAFLPEAAIATFDAWAEPSLAGVPGESQSPKEIVVPVEPRQWASLVAHLTVEQERWGGYLIYGDPTNVKNAYRHALREQLCARPAASGFSYYRMLARLNETQWQQLQSQGLAWGKDLSLQPDGEERRSALAYPLAEGDFLRMGEPEDWPEGPVVVLRRLRVKGSLAGVPPRPQVYWLPTKLRLSPKRTDSLLAAPKADRGA
jgi:hypothetical protein